MPSFDKLRQVEDILRNKLTKRNVDVRFLDDSACLGRASAFGRGQDCTKPHCA